MAFTQNYLQALLKGFKIHGAIINYMDEVVGELISKPSINISDASPSVLFKENLVVSHLSKLLIVVSSQSLHL